MVRISFLRDQLLQIKIGGFNVAVKKIKKVIQFIFSIPPYILSLPLVLLIRLVRPFFLIRFGGLFSSRIGHLAANTELYLCELDEGINRPPIKFFDIFYLMFEPNCNEYLVNMWKRVLTIWPRWIIKPIVIVNRILPGWQLHEICNMQHDRDINNLLDKYKTHISFTQEEEDIGESSLRKMGIPPGADFICLLVRDSAYLNDASWSYHNYRDCTIDNYKLAAEEMAERGYYVVRMGVVVSSKFSSSHGRVIDYATNGMRSEFMDIYLGAKCKFCISTSSGWDAIPFIFRKPIIYAPIVPVGYFFTFSDNFSAITKHHIDTDSGKELTLSEIFERGVGFCMTASDYEEKRITLIENTPEEIRDLVIEFEDRVRGTWETLEKDELLQKQFWQIFPVNATDIKGVALHGQIKGRFGTHFLRQNQNWLN